MSESTNYSFEGGGKKTFHVADYVIFSIVLAVSAIIGVFLAHRDRKKQSTEEFLLAGRKMYVLPVALSLLSSFVSAITVLGTPSEMYIYGTMFFWFGISYFTSSIFAAHLYMPIFYKLRVTSAFEYLDRRFSKSVRTICSVTYCLQTILLMSIVLYAPSLALHAVTDLDLWGTVCAVGVVCTVYTMIGGMKAVLWTDTFQVGVMFLGLIVVLVKGTMEIGGLTKAWNLAAERGRIQFIDFSFDPTVRHSFWALAIGGTFSSLAIYGTNQSQVQRSLTLPTLRKTKLSIWLSMPLKFLLVNLCALVGIVMFAFYRNCDPIKANLVKAKDQILPLFVMDVLGSIPGIPGLFVAVLFSGALSTLSSGLNSMSAAIIQDIVRPFIRPNITDRHALILAKILALVLGVASLGLSYVASLLGGILQAAITLDGVAGGSILGVFTLGMVFPWANSYGAIAGLVCSMGFLMWISVGARVVKPPIQRPPLPVRTAGCMLGNSVLNNINGTTLMTTSLETTSLASNLTDIKTSRTVLETMYSISYLYYALIAVLIVCIVGMLVSLITGLNKPSSLDPRLICPVFDVYFPFLPERVLRPLRFGVDYTLLAEENKKEHTIDKSKDLKNGVPVLYKCSPL